MNDYETPIEYIEKLSLCDVMARKVITMLKQGIITEQQAVLAYMKEKDEITENYKSELISIMRRQTQPMNCIPSWRE